MQATRPGRSAWPTDALHLDDHELDAWQAALDHLAARGYPGIAPPAVVTALATRWRRHGRRHLRVVR